MVSFTLTTLIEERYLSPNEYLEAACEHLDIVIPTGMGAARNIVNVLSSDVVVACRGRGGKADENGRPDPPTEESAQGTDSTTIPHRGQSTRLMAYWKKTGMPHKGTNSKRLGFKVS